MTANSRINYRFIAQSMLEAIPLPALIVDRTLTIRFYNQRSLLLYAASPPLQGKPLHKLIGDPAILALVQECVTSAQPRRGKFGKGSSDLAWKVSVSPLAHQESLLQPFMHEGLLCSDPETSDSPAILAQSPEGEQAENFSSSYCYFAVVVEDMTEGRRLERMQRDFLANISHELRTPLTSVRLLAETLEDAVETDPERAQEFIEKIEIEVHYLSELVAELLELSRLESGQTMMTIEPIEAERLVREVMARMLPLAQRHRVYLTTDIEQGHILVAADSKQIMRVLVNLVHNAIKFTPSDGKIIIGTTLDSEADHMQRFFVRDTGVGIQAEELPRIFERFYKTDRARTKADFIGPGGGGTGLGLAIARHVVTAHSGHIWAESTPGYGSEFSFTLPIAPVGDVLLP